MPSDPIHAAPDEPAFVLVARDAHAPIVVEYWAFQRAFAIAAGLKPRADAAQVEAALGHAQAMRAWRGRRTGQPAGAPSHHRDAALALIARLARETEEP